MERARGELNSFYIGWVIYQSPRNCDLLPLDYFLREAYKEKSYPQKPEIIERHDGIALRRIHTFENGSVRYCEPYEWKNCTSQQ